MLKYRDANDPVSFWFWKGVPHMNEKHMQYVLTVLKEGSFTNAAKKLYVSQPSLSQIIKTAESNLGAPIFNRSTDPITLTPAGQLYVEAARQVTTISTNLVKQVEELSNEEFGKIRLGISVQRGMELLPELYPRFKKRFPHVEIELPGDPMKFTAVPNAIKGKGIWAASGVNEKNVGMTATETITSNARVLGADPLVKLQPAEDGKEEIIGGIGEEDLVYITLPYISSAREGVIRLGSLLEKYGTYEMNGIAFQDVNEIWWLETIGGHHWIAKRVPDDRYVVMPNQFGIDDFDLNDAFSEQNEHMCSSDLREFIAENHLDLSLNGGNGSHFDARAAFGSHSDSDHIYNTPRAWFMERYFNPKTKKWDGPDADYRPESDDIPWSMVPEKKITVEDVKYALSSHFQGTPYDPYAKSGDGLQKGKYRAIGINRNDFLALIQMRPGAPANCQAVQWLAFASNAFNTLVPFYAAVDETPEYLANTTKEVSTENFYWSARMIAAMADASFAKSAIHIERYQNAVEAKGHALLNKYDKEAAKVTDPAESRRLLEEANREIAKMLKEETGNTLDHVLFELSNSMKNAFSRSDA